MGGLVNPLRQLWSGGRCAANGWIACPSVLSAEALAVAGWDSITVDLQHGTADYAALLTLLPVIERSGAAALVRVPWLEESSNMRALDAGALGIIAPMIETAADARRLVKACLYAPEGRRSFGPVRARLVYGDGYWQAANREILPLAMIETRAAMEKLDAIAATPGLAGLYVGPADLALAHARRILDLVSKPITVGGAFLTIGASIGIAMCPEHGTDSETLMRAADMAMYSAKKDGRNTFCFFTHDMEAELRDSAQLESDVRQAIINDECPHYQPLIKLAENSLVGFEILARWRHPTRGDIGPEKFIPVAERLGLIAPLTYSLLRRGCLDAKTWPADITLALNVSPKHLIDPSLPVKLLAILSDTCFPPQRLEIEITETALVADLPAARAVLLALQAVGIKISLDDFGTGYSSLHHLSELRFDKIKIDRSFVLAMKTDTASVKIVNSVVALAASLGLPTLPKVSSIWMRWNKLSKAERCTGRATISVRPCRPTKPKSLCER